MTRPKDLWEDTLEREWPSEGPGGSVAMLELPSLVIDRKGSLRGRDLWG